MKVSQDGIDFIVKAEGGYRLTAYRLPGEKYNTIGVGHYGADVTDGMVITRMEAEVLLRLDLEKFERAVEKYATIRLTQHRFDALVSYTFNRGVGGIKELSEHCRTVSEYSEGIVKYWGKATAYKDALITRRKKERAMFDLDADIPSKTIEELAEEVLADKWGRGQGRRANLTAAGYDYQAIQDEVNRILKEREG